MDLAQATLNSVRLKLGIVGRAYRFQEITNSEPRVFEQVQLTHELYPYSRRVYLMRNTSGEENTTFTGVSTTAKSIPETLTPQEVSAGHQRNHEEAETPSSKTSNDISLEATQSVGDILKTNTKLILHKFVDNGLLQKDWDDVAREALEKDTGAIFVTELPAYPTPGGLYIIDMLSRYGTFGAVTSVPKAAQCQVYAMRNGGRAMKKPAQAIVRLSGGLEDVESEGSAEDKKPLPTAVQWKCPGEFLCKNIKCPSVVLGEDGKVVGCNENMWSYTGKLLKADGSNVICMACKVPATFSAPCEYKWCNLSTPGVDHGLVLVGSANHVHSVKPVGMCTSMATQSAVKVDMKRIQAEEGSKGVGTLRQNLANKYLGEQRAGKTKPGP